MKDSKNLNGPSDPDMIIGRTVKGEDPVSPAFTARGLRVRTSTSLGLAQICIRHGNEYTLDAPGYTWTLADHAGHVRYSGSALTVALCEWEAYDAILDVITNAPRD